MMRIAGDHIFLSRRIPFHFVYYFFKLSIYYEITNLLLPARSLVPSGTYLNMIYLTFKTNYDIYLIMVLDHIYYHCKTLYRLLLFYFRNSCSLAS